jgi:hypothetical protein
MTDDEALAVTFVIGWARGNGLADDEQATCAASTLTAAARQALGGEHPADTRLSTTGTLMERLIQLRAGCDPLNEPLTNAECDAIGTVMNVLDRIQRRTLKEPTRCTPSR